VSLTNQKLLGQDIINYKIKKELMILNFGRVKADLYCYNFKVQFNHEFTNRQLEDMFSKVVDKHADEYPQAPEFKLDSFNSDGILIPSTYI